MAYQFNRILRGSIPFAVTFLLALISVVPTGIGVFAVVTPSFLGISVFYWSIHRPYLMSAPLVFILGVLFDFLSGGPLGLSSLLLLLIHGIAMSQRRVFVGKAFLLTWFGYIVVAFSIAVLSWIIACLYFLSFVPLMPVIAQFLISLLIFPLFAWAFSLLQNNVLRHT